MRKSGKDTADVEFQRRGMLEFQKAFSE